MVSPVSASAPEILLSVYCQAHSFDNQRTVYATTTVDMTYLSDVANIQLHGKDAPPTDAPPGAFIDLSKYPSADTPATGLIFRSVHGYAIPKNSSLHIKLPKIAEQAEKDWLNGIRRVLVNVYLPETSEDALENTLWSGLALAIDQFCQRLFPNLIPKESALIIHRGDVSSYEPNCFTLDLPHQYTPLHGKFFFYDDREQ